MPQNTWPRILMFSPGFAPLANPEAIVNSKLVLTMLNAGWDVDVISRQYIGKIEYDYGSRWIEPWMPLQAHTHEIENDLGNKIKRVSDLIRSALVMGYPIHGCRWASHAYEKAMSLHRQKPYDVILSRALPEAAHLPAMKMAMKTGIPWIANWNDPWNFLRNKHVNGSLRKNEGSINALFSRQSAKRASWCTFPSERMMRKMAPYFNANILQKSTVIPHVALKIENIPIKKNKEKFQICYTGRIRSDYQEINIFLRGCADFILKNKLEDKFSLTFAGIDDIDVIRLSQKYGLSGCIKSFGGLSYLIALQKMLESDVLLVIDAKDADGMILTSKLVDYIQTGRPILAMTTKDSTTERIVNIHKAGFSVSCEEKSELFEALTTLYNCWKEGTLDSVYGSNKAFHLFAPDTIVDAYKEIFKRIKIAPASN